VLAHTLTSARKHATASHDKRLITGTVNIYNLSGDINSLGTTGFDKHQLLTVGDSDLDGVISPGRRAR